MRIKGGKNMKRMMVLTLLLVMIIFCTNTAWGAVVGLGTRAAGMGGAYTAVADDEYAPYWNPAGITNTKHMEVPIGFGFQGDVDKLLNIADKISNNELPDSKDLNQDYYLDGFLGLSTKYFALSGYTDSQLNTSVEDNLQIDAKIQSLNYGLISIASKLGEDWVIGINLKAVGTGYGEVYLPPIPDPTTYTDPAKLQTDLENYKATVSYNTGTGTACDVGALYQLSSQINLGFMARNIFSQVTSDEGKEYTYTLDYTTDPQHPKLNPPTIASYNHSIDLEKSYVLGIAYHPYEATLIAADLETITGSDNDQTRVHVGFEQKMLWDSVAIRLGGFTNKGDPTGYTAGLGFKLWIFNTNLAAVSGNGTGYFLSGSIKF
jgi:hypothetical protein